MPEISEVRIMSEFVNRKAESKQFNNIFSVERGNIPKPIRIIDGHFKALSESNGKELLLKVYHDAASFSISVFMGMSGCWSYVATEDWHKTPYVRLRLDTTDGHSLLLHGSYMGPRYRIGGFSGVKRGPDPTKRFVDFRQNILAGIATKALAKPICEAMLDQKYFNGIGAYLCAEIVGRLDIDPFRSFSSLSEAEIDSLLAMTVKCCEETYLFGGGQLKDWENPFGESRIDQWLRFYGNTRDCHRQKFGKRNIWIKNKFRRA